MATAKNRSDVVYSLYSGMFARGIFKLPIFAVFLAMSLSLFVINYVGLYSVLNLNLSLGGPANAHTSYTVAYAMVLVAAEFFLFFYFLSLGLEIKKRLDSKVRRSLSAAAVAAAYKFPKFLVASIFQLFVFLGGSVLLVVPGFYFGTKMLFFSVLNHGNDFTFAGALKESSDAIRGSFAEGLLLLVAYVVIFAALSYAFLASGLPLAWKIALVGVFASFVSLSFLSSSDTLYHLLKSQMSYRRPPLVRQILSNPV